MKYYENYKEDRILNINQCIEHFESVDVFDKEEVIKSAWALKALANNKNLLNQIIHEDLKNGIDHFQQENYYTPQSLILGRGTNFYLRANIWVAQPLEEVNDEDVHIYNLCHDHNFNFLTVGYFGPGYKTRIYDYDKSTVKGEVGEKINMKYLGQYQLKQGDVMYYERSKDIHTQIPPEKLSVSLNLMISQPEQFFTDQYEIKESTGEITQLISPSVNSQEFLTKLAAKLGDKDSVKKLKKISRYSSIKRVRTAAHKAMVELEEVSHG